jgi:hypothetical protein
LAGSGYLQLILWQLHYSYRLYEELPQAGQHDPVDKGGYLQQLLLLAFLTKLALGKP